VTPTSTGGDRSVEEATMRATVANVAPGTVLREGLERILRGRTGLFRTR